MDFRLALAMVGFQSRAMESLIPTLKISLSDDRFQVLEVTINPIFFIATRRVSAIPDFHIWIELVLGHRDEMPLTVPEVTFSFNRACNFGESKAPPTIDYFPPTTESGNFLIYNHFWSDPEDLLQSAYGADSVRVIPKNWLGDVPGWATKWMERSGSRPIGFERGDDVKAAFAFRRTTYVGNPLYTRINYPSSFHVARAESDDAKNVVRVVIPQPFSLLNAKPMPRLLSLSNRESISFWYHYPYQLLSSSHDQSDRGDLIIFYHNFLFEASFIEKSLDSSTDESLCGAATKEFATSLNCFPRLPFRFEIRRSDPQLVASPRLAVDPPVWTRTNMPMYPAKPVGEVRWDHTSPEQYALSLVAEIVDTRANILKELITLAFGLLSSIIISIATLYGKKTTWAWVIFVSLLWLVLALYFYSRGFQPFLRRVIISLRTVLGKILGNRTTRN